MRYPTKHEQFAFEVGLAVAAVLVAVVAGVCLGWTVAQCFRALAGAAL